MSVNMTLEGVKIVIVGKWKGRKKVPVNRSHADKRIGE